MGYLPIYLDLSTGFYDFQNASCTCSFFSSFLRVFENGMFLLFFFQITHGKCSEIQFIIIIIVVILVELGFDLRTLHLQSKSATA
jgi:hypothetical protein